MPLTARIAPGPLIARLALALFAAAAYAQNPLEQSGFQHFYNLEYDEALADFQAEAARNPGSPDALNHVAQAIMFRAMFRAGALDSGFIAESNPFLHRPPLPLAAPEEMIVLDSLSRSIDLCEKRLKENPRDTAALYALGVAHGLRGNYDFVVKKAWLDTLHEVTAARKAHNKVTEIDPSMTDARLVEGLHDYVVGSLPFTWKAVGFLAGFRGDKEAGIQELKLVAERGRVNRADAVVLLESVLRRERRPAEALPMMLNLVREFPRNYLFHLEVAYLYGDMSEKPAALAALAEVEGLMRNHAPGYDRLSEAKLHYVRGALQFRFGDMDAALAELEAVTSRSSQIDRHSEAAAWLRIGQAHDIKMQRTPAVEAYREAIRILPNSDVSSEAKAFISSRYRR